VGAALKVHETTTADGRLAPVVLGIGAGALSIVADGVPLALPHGALEAVMARYGAPLETAERLLDVASLDLGDGRALRHVRHLARYDVIARDYLVYEAPGREPVCALATTVAGALEHLAQAANR
jgi:hypothetical protein